MLDTRLRHRNGRAVHILLAVQVLLLTATGLTCGQYYAAGAMQSDGNDTLELGYVWWDTTIYYYTMSWWDDQAVPRLHYYPEEVEDWFEPVVLNDGETGVFDVYPPEPGFYELVGHLTDCEDEVLMIGVTILGAYAGGSVNLGRRESLWGLGNPDLARNAIEFIRLVVYEVDFSQHPYGGRLDLDIEFEFHGYLLGDVNGDCYINTADLLLLLEQWGPCPLCPADLDMDGEVDTADLLTLLSNWGW